MGSNFAVRAAVSGDLVKFRAESDWSRLGLAIQHPVTVYTARINQATFEDGLAELTYDGGVGTLANVLMGMTVHIGSSSGAMDRGIYRVRKAPTSSILYINQTSKIAFANDDWLTVVNVMPLLQRDLTQTGELVRMDYDIEFGDYRNNVAIPRIAPMVAVINQTSGTITFTPPSPALSACYDGSTIASVLYEAPGATTTSNMTSQTGTASWTYPLTAYQEYRWSCKLILDTGAEITSHRWVFVNPASIPFKFVDCAGDLQNGDWSFSFTCYDDVAKTEVYDRALVTLYSTDFYGGVKGSVGKIAGYENIWASGWIDEDSTTYDSEIGETTFTVRGPAFWEKKLRAMPITLQDVSGAPAIWGEITEMTADKAMAFMLFWTSTAPFIMDCFFTGDTTRQKIFSLPGGNLFDQISEIAVKIFAAPLVNNYGQMYVEVDSQLISSANRAALTVVMDITKADRKDGLDIVRNQEKVAMVELGAHSYDGTTLSNIHSRAPGNTGGIFGDIDPYDDYMIVDQAECNRISGCLLAMRNGEFEPLEILFPTLIKLFDICPRMYATITVLAADNPRGIALTSARLIPRSVKYVEDASGVYSTVVTFEVETIGVDGVDYYPPIVTDGIADYIVPDIGDVDFPNSGLEDWFPPQTPIDPISGPCGGDYNAFSVGWDKSELRGDDVDRIARIYFPCRVRPKSYNYVSPSQVVIGGTMYGDASAHLTLYGIKSGVRVITADASFQFDPASPLEVDGFELELDAGLGSIVEYIVLGVAASGSVNATDETGTALSTTDGNYYAIESTGGPFKGHLITDEHYVQDFYTFTLKDATRSNEPISGVLGVGWYLDYPSLAPVYGENLGTIGIDAYSLGFPSARMIFLAGATTVRYLVGDSIKADNSGTLGFILRDVEVRGRRIVLGTAIVKNVCAIG